MKDENEKRLHQVDEHADKLRGVINAAEDGITDGTVTTTFLKRWVRGLDRILRGAS